MKNGTTNPATSWRHLAAAVALVLLLGACSESQTSDLPDDLPDTITHEPSAETPQQKHSTTYEPNQNNETIESIEPDLSNEAIESDEPSQGDDN